MEHDYIAKHYGIRFNVGDRVRFLEGKPREGTVARSSVNQHYVRVKWGNGSISYCHPRSLAIIEFSERT